MTVQPNITILTELPQLPAEPIHWCELDLQGLVSARLDQIADELLEVGCTIPCDVVFMIEALGGVVNLDTGMVTHAEL